MGISNWNATFYEGTYTIGPDGETVKVNTERVLNNKDQLPKNRAVIAVLSVSGFSGTDSASYFKAQISPYAYSKQVNEQGHNISIRPKTIIATNDGQIIETHKAVYSTSTEGETPIEITNYPVPFSQYGETDTYTVIVGPFEGDAVLNYDDIVTGSVAIIMYEGSQKNPGPMPTSTGNGQ